MQKSLLTKKQKPVVFNLDSEDKVSKKYQPFPSLNNFWPMRRDKNILVLLLFRQPPCTSNPSFLSPDTSGLTAMLSPYLFTLKSRCSSGRTNASGHLSPYKQF